MKYDRTMKEYKLKRVNNIRKEWWRYYQ